MSPRPIREMRTGKTMNETPEVEDAMPLPTSYRPTSKVAAGGAAGAISIVLVWAASQLGIDLPPEVASSLTTVVAFAAAYFKKN